MAITVTKLFGDIAVEQRFCSRDQIEEALEIQRTLTGREARKPLGAILHELGYLSLVQINKINDRVDDAKKRRSIDGYDIVSELGKGANSAVYLARQVSLNKLVALKVLPKKLAQDDETLARFRREALSTAKLNHPGIVQAYDVGESNGFHYLVMEYIQGETLKARIEREGRITASRTIDMAYEIASALAHASQHRIVHRDVKPANVMIMRNGQAKLCDLGLAISKREDHTLTKPGIIMGTPYYLSPEQARGEEIDERTDLYSLGATLFHAVTGRVPFDGESTAVIITRHLTDETPDPRDLADVPDALAAVIVRLMSKEREDRYQSAEELIADLDSLRRTGRLALGTRTSLRVGQDDTTKKTRAIVEGILPATLVAPPVGDGSTKSARQRAKVAEEAAELFGEEGGGGGRGRGGAAGTGAPVPGEPAVMGDDDDTWQARLRAARRWRIGVGGAAIAVGVGFAVGALLVILVAGDDAVRPFELRLRRALHASDEVPARAIAGLLEVEARELRAGGYFRQARAVLAKMPPAYAATEAAEHVAHEVERVDLAARDRFTALRGLARSLAAAGEHDAARTALEPALDFGLSDILAATRAELDAIELQRRGGGGRGGGGAAGGAPAAPGGPDAALAEIFPSAQAATARGHLAQAIAIVDAAIGRAAADPPAVAALKIFRKDLAAIEAIRTAAEERGRRPGALPIDDQDPLDWITPERAGSPAAAARARGLYQLLRERYPEARAAFEAAAASGEDVSVYRTRLAVVGR